ncbi:MAG: molybdate ABC transporter substrate-binding protein [gamma proteobacterium symbiont of Taylorina sp.]|nr:molybdate ABC transporter substrate-binding protein [gamma proteobacterium symbiont of Taylorina sp.]
MSVLKIKTVCISIFFPYLIFLSNIVPADTIRVASASNFTATIKVIAHQFEKESGHQVTIISGSSGKHYAQIKNGAPFDAFFSADSKRAELLDKEKIAIPGSRFIYAVGKVVLWSPKKNYVDKKAQILTQGKFRYLAIANPKLAPYGLAAQEILKTFKLWDKLRSRMVRGENIGQTFQFVKSTNAALGFVALSQIKRPNQSIEGSYWRVPQSLYTPILQQAVLLKESEAGHLFLAYMKSRKAQQIIQDFGYDVTEGLAYAQ